MESKLKQAAQDSVGELPNLLLREGGYPHLPTTPIKQEPQLTNWISGDLKPVRDGVYQRKSNHVDRVIYAKFKDGYWFCWNHSPELASKSNFIAIDQHLSWRGLSSNPNEAYT